METFRNIRPGKRWWETTGLKEQKGKEKKTPCVLYKDPEFQRTPEDLPIHAQDIDR
jgi:hypothetical protein